MNGTTNYANQNNSFAYKISTTEYFFSLHFYLFYFLSPFASLRIIYLIYKSISFASLLYSISFALLLYISYFTSPLASLHFYIFLIQVS
jgi:hypothetical protein